MKKILKLVFVSILSITCLTGCLKRDMMENIDIVTTIYPIEYITNRLYGQNNNVKSLYPRGSNSFKYKVSEKQLKDYSNYDLFIYNGKSDEKEYATKMLNNNRNLRIIDASFGLNITYSESDIWLNPSNVLMISKNIKDELSELIINQEIVNDININYEQLKLDITVIETELKKTADNSIDNTIVVNDESLNFLKIYGFKVINLTKNGKNVESNIQKATRLFEQHNLTNIFILKNTKEYDITSELKDRYNLKTLTFDSLDTIDEQSVKDNNDYISLMNNNISLLKEETYK